MRALPPRLTRIAVAATLVSGLIAAPAVAGTLDDKLKSAGEALTAATKQVIAARKSLAQAQAQLPGARAALNRAASDEAVAQGAYISASNKVTAAKADYTTALALVTSKQAEIDQLQSKVNQFARSVYQQGQASQWEIILEAQSPGDLASRLQTIKSVAQASASSLNELSAAKTQLKTEADKANAVKVQMQHLASEAHSALVTAEAASARAAVAKAKVDKLIRQQAAALKVAQADRRKIKRQYDLLKAEQLRLALLSGKGSHGNGNPQATGPLSWPLPGRGAGGSVGWRIHPIYHYRSCHTGVDIGAPKGTPIKASEAGVVLSTGWSTAYGNVTLIDHGKGLVTMYAHQYKFAVKVRQIVAEGDTIGYVGSTGYSTGPHLHFEVHINGVPYDPMGWFGGSKVVVPCWGK